MLRYFVVVNTLSLYCVFLFASGGMDEDGSFIGKYAKNRNTDQSSAFATLV